MSRTPRQVLPSKPHVGTAAPAVQERSSAALPARITEPQEKLPKRCPAMAVLRLLLRSKFSKSFVGLRKVKQRVIAKPIGSTRRIQNNPLGLPMKHRESLTRPRCCNHTNKPPSPLF